MLSVWQACCFVLYICIINGDLLRRDIFYSRNNSTLQVQMLVLLIVPLRTLQESRNSMRLL